LRVGALQKTSVFMFKNKKLMFDARKYMSKAEIVFGR